MIEIAEMTPTRPMDDRPSGTGRPVTRSAAAEELSPGGLEYADWDENDPVALCEVLDRVLNKGVVLRGDVVLSVAGIDLVYVGLDLLVCSVDKARAIGARSWTAGDRRGDRR